MEFLGIIRSVGEPTEWTGQSQTHVEREIVVATAEEYPQVGVFTLYDELAQNFSLHTQVQCDFPSVIRRHYWTVLSQQAAKDITAGVRVLNSQNAEKALPMAEA